MSRDVARQIRRGAIRRSAASALRAAARLRARARCGTRCSMRAATCGLVGVEREHDVGEEVVAGAVGAVELGLVALREGADQRAHAVRDWSSEKAGCAVSARTRVERVGLGDRGLQREPFVDDQRIVAIALVEIVERRLRAPARRAATASPAPPCGRSCCRRRGIARPRADRACSLAGRGQQIEAGVARARAGRRSRRPGCRAPWSRMPLDRRRAARSPSVRPISARSAVAGARRSRRDRRRGRSRGRCRLRSAASAPAATKAGSSAGVGEDGGERREQALVRCGVLPARSACDIADQEPRSPASAPPASG